MEGALPGQGGDWVEAGPPEMGAGHGVEVGLQDRDGVGWRRGFKRGLGGGGGGASQRTKLPGCLACLFQGSSQV